MSEVELPELAARLDQCWALKEQVMSGDAKAAFFQVLRPYPLAGVLAGLDAHMRDPERGRFLPMPADVIAQMERMIKQDGRPEPEEAWAIAVPARDEAATVIWTDEIANAWQVAVPVIEIGDEVGARVAFRDTYRRLVDAARLERQPVRWFASEGHDPMRRRLAVEHAVKLGRLPASAVPQLPAPEKGQLLLGGLDPKAVPPNVRAAIERFRATVAAKGEAPGQDGAEKQRTRELKAEVQAKVDAFQQQGETDARDPA